MNKKALILLLFVVLGATPALACKPLLAPPGTIVRGMNSAIGYNTGDGSVGMAEAEDLGNGFVMQKVFAGHGCWSEERLVISDCDRGQSVVLGTFFWHWPSIGTPKIEQLIAEVKGAAAKPDTDILASAREASVALGLTDIAEMASNDSIKLRGKRLRLASACSTFYPDK